MLDEIGDGAGVIRALVFDELAYRLMLSWLRDDGYRDPLSTYRADPRGATAPDGGVVRGRLLRPRAPTHGWRNRDAGRVPDVTVGPRPWDAFHVAHALEADCDLTASSDPRFDPVLGLNAWHPTSPSVRHQV